MKASNTDSSSWQTTLVGSLSPPLMIRSSGKTVRLSFRCCDVLCRKTCIVISQSSGDRGRGDKTALWRKWNCFEEYEWLIATPVLSRPVIHTHSANSWTRCYVRYMLSYLSVSQIVHLHVEHQSHSVKHNHKFLSSWATCDMINILLQAHI